MAAKYNIYAVARGLDKESGTIVTNMLFKTWEEAKPYVIGIDNARYKGFLSEDEANMWMAQVSAEEIVAPAAKTKVKESEIEIICKELGITRKELDAKLEKRFIEDYKMIKSGR